ncbi:MAG: CHAT domain-containing protein [Planctomycetes bacterium]|nr:CHAT domain-containing protein [Planctomycetota bacterium]
MPAAPPVAPAPAPAPPASAPKPAPPPPLKQAADAVLAATKAKDDAALGALAAQDVPDPWRVVDQLIRQGEHDAAEAFAKASPRVDTEALPAYVASRRGKADDPARRERLKAADAAMRARRLKDALTALGEPEPGPIEDVPGVAMAQMRAFALLRLEREEAALAATRAAAEAAHRLGWMVMAAELHNAHGVAAYHVDRYDEALEAWGRAVALAERRGDKEGAAQWRGNIANVDLARGDLVKAVATYEQVLAEMETLGDKRGAATMLGNLGNAYHALGDFAKAKATQERALRAREAVGDRANVIAAREALALLHVEVGEVVKGLGLYERALAEAEALGLQGKTASLLGGIASAHSALGNFAQALAYFERSRARFASAGHKPGAAAAMSNIAMVRVRLGDHAGALPLFERALADQVALGDRRNASKTLTALAVAHSELGDETKAKELYERALADAEAIGDRRLVAVCMNNIATTHAKLGDHAAARALYERALATREALGDKRGVSVMLNNIGASHQAQGDLKAARAALERAVRMARSLRAVPELVSSLKHLAIVHLREGDSGRALGAAREALTASETLLGGLGEEEGAQARATQGKLYAVGAQAAVRDADTAELCAFLESGRAGALLDALDKREHLRWKSDTLPEELKVADSKAASAERAARNAYEQALKGEDRRAKAAAAGALDEALEEVRTVNARIQRETKRAAGIFYPRSMPLEDVAASLEAGEALVIYGLCLDEAVALVVEPEGERLVVLGASKEVEAACEALALRTPDDDPAAALATLRGLLVEPLALGQGVKQVLVSPEGPLCFLPWGALVDRAVAVTPSGSTHALLRSEEREPGQGVLALGDPDYAGASEAAQAIYYRGRRLSPLPATRSEVETVSSVALLGAEASEDGVVAALPQQERWRAVHFACHGLIDPRRPGLSSLALSRTGDDDGFLTALEVLRMRIPADLAVLSACETATGQLVGGEGIVGLTRAFMYAGAPRVICSLWKVDDEATRVLMVKFYELWNPRDGKPGLPAAEALRQAQGFVRAQARWKHPYYWAAWVLWGLPD